MKTKLLFATALLAVSSITSADTLSNLLNDIPKNLSLVEKTGNCDMNVERVTDNSGSYPRDSWRPIDDRCEPVVAQCEKGKTIIPSSCEVTYSDGSKVGGNYMMGEQEVSKTDFVKGTQSCNIQIPYQYPSMEGRTTRDVTIKATARCIKTPANFIQNTAKKLGITIK
jgi:hypothetical protein